jgi:hypothetical protein
MGYAVPSFAQSVIEFDPLCSDLSSTDNHLSCVRNGAELAVADNRSDFRQYTADYKADTTAICKDVIEGAGYTLGPSDRVLAGCSVRLTIWNPMSSVEDGREPGQKFADYSIHDPGGFEGKDLSQTFFKNSLVAVHALFCGCALQTPELL